MLRAAAHHLIVVVLLLLVSAAPAGADPAVRIAGISANLLDAEIDASALVVGAPARVVFEIVPEGTPAAAPTRVDAARRPARKEAIAALGPDVAQWVARLPAPAQFGAFRGRVLAYAADGAQLARSEADWARPFSAHVTVKAASPTVDVSAAAGDAVWAIDIGGASAIDAIAVQTSAHVGAELGFGHLPYEAAQDERSHGLSFPPFTARLVRRGDTRFELHITVPAALPPRLLSIDRIYLRDRAGHYAEQAPAGEEGDLRVVAKAPRPSAFEVRAAREQRNIVVSFRYAGPVVGSARSLYGFPVPNVQARVRDRVRQILGRCVPAESPLADPPWSGAAMTCRLNTGTRGDHPLLDDARLSLAAGGQLVGEAALAQLLKSQ